MADAYAWALYASGRDREAPSYAREAMGLGSRNALFLFHAGMIQLALGNATAADSLLAAALGSTRTSRSGTRRRANAARPSERAA